MKNSAEYAPSLSFALVLLGAPKLGKTTLALQFPKPYIADCDNNLSGPAAFLQANGLQAFAYDTINIDDAIEVPPSKRWIRLTKCATEAVKSPEIKTIIIDSLTSVSEYLIDHILAVEGQKAMRIQDWMPFQFMLKRFIIWLRSSGKLVIVTAHENVEKDEVDGILKYFIAIPTKLKDSLGGLFSDAWRMECQQVGSEKFSFLVRSKPSVRFALGTSLINLPPVVSASFAEIKKYAPQLDVS